MAVASPPPLHQTRCFNHLQREAVARCPGCQKFYCRECVTEHDGRLLCRACVGRAAEETGARSAAWRSLGTGVLRIAAGLLLLYAVFSSVGRVLQTLPNQFHEVREAPWEEGP